MIISQIYSSSQKNKNKNKNQACFPDQNHILIRMTSLSSQIQQQMKKHFPHLLLISILCLFFTAISNSNIGIISQLASQNDNQWIGSVSIALIFMGSGVGGIYNNYIGKYLYNRIIFTGALGWDLFVAFSVMFLFIGFQNYVITIIIIGSFTCGVIVSLYYIGTFNYINECGKRDGSVQQYYAINLCFNQSSNILGNSLSTLLIQPLGQKIYSFVMLGLCIFFSFCFLFIKGFKQQLAVQPNNQSLVTEGTDNQLIASTNNKQLPPSKAEKPHLTMVLCFAVSGVIISFIYGQFSILFYKYYQHMEKEELNSLTFTTFMIEGCGQFAGGLLLAWLATRTKHTAFIFTVNSILFLVSIGFIYYGFNSDSKAIIMVAAFFAGISDCLAFAMGLSIASRWNESGLSLFNVGQNFAVTILSVLHIFIEFEFLCIIYGSVIVLAIVALFAERRRRKSDPNQLEHL